MQSRLRVLVSVSVCALLAACNSRDASTTPVVAQQSAPAKTPAPQPAALPSSTDLRPHLTQLGFTPRPQGHRGTCSIFTTCESIEFAIAKRTGSAKRLSPEFVNWAASQAAGGPSDGNFFHNALAGFEQHGVCTETLMPYQENFDAKHAPTSDALADAKALREQAKEGVAIRWIVPWQPNHFGVNAEQFAEIKRVLASGYPVASGSGHSRLLVGYQDNPEKPGGGTFITEDSALNRFDEVSYEFVQREVADVFWIEALPK